MWPEGLSISDIYVFVVKTAFFFSHFVSFGWRSWVAGSERLGAGFAGLDRLGIRPLRGTTPPLIFVHSPTL